MVLMLPPKSNFNENVLEIIRVYSNTSEKSNNTASICGTVKPKSVRGAETDLVINLCASKTLN